MTTFRLRSSPPCHPGDVFTLIVDRVTMAATGSRQLAPVPLTETRKEIAYFRTDERQAAEMCVNFLNATAGIVHPSRDASL